MKALAELGLAFLAIPIFVIALVVLIDCWPIWLYFVVCVAICLALRDSKSLLLKSAAKVLKCAAIGLAILVILQLVYSVFDDFIGDSAIRQIEDRLTSLHASLATFDEIGIWSFLAAIGVISVIDHFLPRLRIIQSFGKVRDGISAGCTIMLVACSFTFFSVVPISAIAHNAEAEVESRYATLKEQEAAAVTRTIVNERLIEKMKSMSPQDSIKFCCWMEGIHRSQFPDKAQVAQHAADRLVPRNGAKQREGAKFKFRDMGSAQDWANLKQSEITAKTEVEVAVKGEEASETRLRLIAQAVVEGTIGSMSQLVPPPIRKLFSDNLAELAGVYVAEVGDSLTETQLDKRAEAKIPKVLFPDARNEDIQRTRKSIEQMMAAKSRRPLASEDVDVFVAIESYSSEVDAAEIAEDTTAKTTEVAIDALAAARAAETAKAVDEDLKIVLEVVK